MGLKLFLSGVLVCTLLIVTPFVGPVRSGAWRLLAAAPLAAQEHDIDPDYEPLHKGHIHLGTGLYIRHDEDLIVRGTPALVLRRTYRSGFNIQREFGIGTTHNGGRLVEGDPDQFQWAEFADDESALIRFERISSGTSYSNALFEHRSSPSEWQGAQLGWTGTGWAARRRDGYVMMFQGCGQGSAPHCWILWERDADGHRIDYKRDATGRLLRIQASPDRWIAFDYDEKNRIRRAHSSDEQEVQYEYDGRGRLSHARGSDGIENRYTYTDRNELTSIDTGDALIENTYDESGRVIRQVNQWPDDDEPYVFDFNYTIVDGRVTHVESKHSDDTWWRLRYENRYIVEESWGAEGYQPLTFKYQRDRLTNIVQSVTLTCPDRKGRAITHSAVSVRPESEEWTKWDLVRTVCAWREERWRQPR